MTVIQKYTPFWRDLNVDTCNKSRDIIYIPLNNNFNFQIPEDTKIGYNGGNYFDLLDVATDVYSFDIDEDFEVKINGEYESVSNQKFTLNLYGSENEFIETIGVVQFVNCDDLIQIDYQLNCYDEFYYYYYFKGAVTRKPANQTESTTFLNKKGISELVFSITEKPVLLRTTPLGWIEQDYIESIINLFTIKLNGMEIFKSKTPYTVTSSKTPKMIGTILLVTSALIFNACCKDADIPTDLKSFKIEDVRGKAEMEMTVTFKSQYLSTSNFDDGLFGDNPFVFGLHFAGGSQLWATPSDEISPYVYMSGSDYALDGADVMTVLQANYIANKDNSLPLTVSFSGLVMTIKWTDSLVNGLGNAGGIIVFEPNAKTPALRENWITLSSTSIGYTYFDDVSNGFGSFTLTQTDSFAYKLIVNINGFDTDVTSEVVGNLWERLASEDIITTYKITSEDGLTTYRAGTVEIF